MLYCAFQKELEFFKKRFIPVFQKTLVSAELDTNVLGGC
jgi:hypothetical protein